MVHVLCTLIPAAHHDLLIVVEVRLCHTLHLLAHRGREHQRVMICRQRFEDLVDAIRETHIQHLVGLVEHDVRHLFEMGLAAMHQVHQTARRGNDNLHTLFQGPYLRLDGSTAIYGLHVYPLHIFGEIAEVVGNLQTQFPRRREYQCLRLASRRVYPFQQGDAKGRRLTRTSLSEGDDIVLIPQQIGNHLLLHRHRLHKAQLLDGLADSRINA